MQRLAAIAFLCLVTQRGETAAAVNLAVEVSAFSLALDTAKAHCPEQTQEVYLQLARHKEASGDIAEAEEAYLKARAPAAAIALYKKRVSQSTILASARCVATKCRMLKPFAGTVTS